MKAPDTCDVCGHTVPTDQGVRAELSVGGAMCPTAMVFHDACYEQAKGMWEPDPDSACSFDPMFPETAQWTSTPEDAPA